MSQEQVKWEMFVKEHKIEFNDLPENVQSKVQKFNETYDEYDELEDTEENQTALRNLELEMKTMDNGILSDLESFHAKQKESAPEGEPTPQAGDGGQTPPTPPTPPQHQASDKPSWAFWM